LPDRRRRLSERIHRNAPASNANVPRDTPGLCPQKGHAIAGACIANQMAPAPSHISNRRTKPHHCSAPPPSQRAPSTSIEANGWSYTDTKMTAIILNGTACADLQNRSYSNFQFIYTCSTGTIILG
jgi:hypothetical protein